MGSEQEGTTVYGFPLFDLPFSHAIAIESDRVISFFTPIRLRFVVALQTVPSLCFGSICRSFSLAATVLVYGHLRKQLFAHFRIASQCVKSFPSDCALVGNRLASDGNQSVLWYFLGFFRGSVRETILCVGGTYIRQSGGRSVKRSISPRGTPVLFAVTNRRARGDLRRQMFRARAKRFIRKYLRQLQSPARGWLRVPRGAKQAHRVPIA